jgi:S1-C subfamily serine protease
MSGDAYGQGYPFDVGFGPFTGAIPYPDSLFAPYAAAAAADGSSAGTTASDRATGSGRTARTRDFGIDEQPVVDSSGSRGMKISRVYPGTSAEKAGLKVGDVIRSINGYLTEQPGNIAWIIANAAPIKVLQMHVRTAADDRMHAITARLP